MVAWTPDPDLVIDDAPLTIDFRADVIMIDGVLLAGQGMVTGELPVDVLFPLSMPALRSSQSSVFRPARTMVENSAPYGRIQNKVNVWLVGAEVWCIDTGKDTVVDVRTVGGWSDLADDPPYHWTDEADD